MHHNSDLQAMAVMLYKYWTHKDKMSIFRSVEQGEIVTSWVYVVSRKR